MVQISKYIMHKVLNTHYISKQIEKRNFEFKIPRLLRVLNRSDRRSKLSRIDCTKFPTAPVLVILEGLQGLGAYIYSIDTAVLVQLVRTS